MLCAEAYQIASQVAGTWVELQELSLAVKMSTEWFKVIEEALHGGGLRNLRTISIDGMNSESTLWNLMTMISQHSIPVTSLRFHFEEDDTWGYHTAFGPGTLAHVFASLPYLDIICVDQPNVDDYYSVEGDLWPGPWDEYPSVFTRARRLRTLIVPCASFVERGALESDVYTILYVKVESLIQACPTLSLVVCTTSNGLSERRYTRAAEPSALGPVQGRNVHLAASPSTLDNFRFWIPPEDIDVAASRHDSCCAQRDPDWESVPVG